MIREVERIRKRKDQSPLSASWHRNVGIALTHCPFELAEATPEAIREWIDQMQDSGLSGLTINSECSLLSSLASKCMKSGLLHGMAMNPFDAADYSAGEVDHIYTAIERDYRDLSGLLPKLLDRQLIPVLIQVYCGTRISEVRKRKREDFDLERGTMQVAPGTAKNKAKPRLLEVIECLMGIMTKDSIKVLLCLFVAQFAIAIPVQSAPHVYVASWILKYSMSECVDDAYTIARKHQFTYGQ
ncbi:Phage integrase family domain protein [Synechococcus sp. WH 8109]|nr:Phage integrase family domain protein [Synechococcus sp. WH 8109]